MRGVVESQPPLSDCVRRQVFCRWDRKGGWHLWAPPTVRGFAHKPAEPASLEGRRLAPVGPSPPPRTSDSFPQLFLSARTCPRGPLIGEGGRSAWVDSVRFDFSSPSNSGCDPLSECWFLDFADDCVPDTIFSDIVNILRSKYWLFFFLSVLYKIHAFKRNHHLFFSYCSGGSNHSVLKEINLNIHWKDWCWVWTSNTLATWCKELTHWKRPWCWERLRAGGEGDDRGRDGWMVSPIRWTWVWVDSWSLWRRGRPAVLRSMGSQRVRHDWSTEQQQHVTLFCIFQIYCKCVIILSWFKNKKRKRKKKKKTNLWLPRG